MPQPTAEQKGDPPAPTNHFPHLPPYQDPTTGILARLPKQCIPYSQLMRLDRPGGFHAYYAPYLIGLSYAACVVPVPPPPARLLELATLFLPLSVLLRGIACTWNDTVDQTFDARVERTRHRPVARGAVSTGQALCFLLAQVVALCGLLVVRAGSLPGVCAVHVGVSTVLFVVYALMKRVTYYPQVVLGFPFAWAIFVCLGALGVDPLGGEHLGATMALFGANVLWTVSYDTIYAHQDVRDDEKAGVKGMALRFRHTTKLLASVLTVVQVLLLALCGIWAGLGPLFFVGSVGGVAVAMAYFIYDVDLSRPESCGAWFGRQFWLVGGGFVLGFAVEYVRRLQ